MTTKKSIWKGALRFTPGRGGYKPEYFVIHIMAGSLIGTDAWFNDPRCNASAHSGVGSNGEVHDYVHSFDTAYHAGVTPASAGPWKNFKHTPEGKLVNVNSYTLGLEHEGHPGTEITEECYKASARKIKYWSNRYSIPIEPERFVRHSEIYPGHNCPADAINIDKLIEMAKVAEPIEPA